MKFLKFMLVLFLFITFSLIFHNAIIGIIIALGIYILGKYLIKFSIGRLKVIGMKTIILIITLSFIVSLFFNIKPVIACSLVNEFTGGLSSNISIVSYTYVAGRNAIQLRAENIPDTDNKAYATYYDNNHPTYISGVAYNVSYTIKDESNNILSSGSYISGIYGVSPSVLVAQYNNDGYDLYDISLNSDVYNAISNGSKRIISFSISPINTCLQSSWDENRFYMLNANFTITAQGKDNITLQNGKTYNINGQLQSYDCLTNQAIFRLSANFNVQSVSIDGLDTLGNNSKIINYSFDQNTWNLTVNFSNDINENTTQHTLFITGSGIDPDTGNNASAKGHIDFDTSNCSENNNIKPKEFKIIKPVNGEHFDSGTSSIEIECAYGGNVENDFPNADKYEVSGTIKYEGMADAGGFDISNYTIDNGITYWKTTATLTKNDDGTYQIYASLWTDTMRGEDTVTIVIGKASGNPIIDFLNHLWQEFKEWFVKTMKYLFVPTDAEMQELANDVQNLNLKNYIPFLNKSDTQCDCLTLLDSSQDNSSIFKNVNIHWQICISSVPDNIWNIIKISVDIFLTLALLLLIIKSIGA